MEQVSHSRTKSHYHYHGYRMVGRMVFWYVMLVFMATKTNLLPLLAKNAEASPYLVVAYCSEILHGVVSKIAHSDTWMIGMGLALIAATYVLTRVCAHEYPGTVKAYLPYERFKQ
ncbi:hypothetical protein SAMN02745129_2064 [Ferrimonas marina]|uniref:Uncharacterized protein n=2 Tax=Ferrimonas marina TaxID=299255 RepID=A0A1M5TAZ0_9GAMM|nr:hypothetical protein SAMN02745129_2064 [Ferrimonas marina]